jgi:dihydrofolate synthase/folylpolyglutamate synthase
MNGFAVCPALEGEHQARNVATALTVLATLEDETGTHKLMPDRVRDGLEHTCWPGRFQLVEAAVPVVIDGAHCVLSASALGQACKARFGDAPATVVVGFLKDKAGKDMLEALAEWVNIHDVIAVAPPTPRSVPVEHITETLKDMRIRSIKSAESVEQAISAGVTQAQDTQGYVVIYGSLYLVGPALAALGQSSAESST